jgi:anti-anti-sigma factor
MSHAIDDQSPSPIHVELRPVRFRTFAARVALCGEHDMATANELRVALGALCGNVLVDFEQCEFCDSSIVHVLLEAARAHRREGQRIELYIPPTNAQMLRIVEIMDLASWFAIHSDLEDLAEPTTADSIATP